MIIHLSVVSCRQYNVSEGTSDYESATRMCTQRGGSVTLPTEESVEEMSAYMTEKSIDRAWIGLKIETIFWHYDTGSKGRPDKTKESLLLCGDITRSLHHTIYYRPWVSLRGFTLVCQGS